MWIRAGRKEGERDIRGKQEKKDKSERAREGDRETGRGLFRPDSGTVPLSIKVRLTQWKT